jgi:hypothetical protein
VYTLTTAPNKLPLAQDVRILITLGYDNAVAFVLMNTLGILPVLIAALSLPTMSSETVSACDAMHAVDFQPAA